MTKLILLTTENCPACATIKDALEEIKIEFPKLHIIEIDTDSKEGEKIIDDYGIMSAPAILINSQLFSTGIVAKDEILKQLKEVEG
jgi:glutaredoxin